MLDPVPRHIGTWLLVPACRHKVDIQTQVFIRQLDISRATPSIIAMENGPSLTNSRANNGPLLQPAEIEMLLNTDLIERRRSVRTIPCPDAIECDDEESWSAWNELMAQPAEQSKVAKAMAAVVHLLLHRT